MMEEDAIRHWRREAQGSLTMARAGLREKEYALALFHCHLAIEKALKAEWIAERGSPDVPHTHDLTFLARELQRTFNEEQRKLFSDLNDFAVAARYSDPIWAESQATEKQTIAWIEKTVVFLTSLHHGT